MLTVDPCTTVNPVPPSIDSLASVLVLSEPEVIPKLTLASTTYSPSTLLVIVVVDTL